MNYKTDVLIWNLFEGRNDDSRGYRYLCMKLRDYNSVTECIILPCNTKIVENIVLQF